MTSTPSALRAFGSSLRRYSTLVILAVILGAGTAAFLSFRSAVSYTGTGTYLVPPGTTGAVTVTPYDAERIARTYSVVLADDDALLNAVGSSLQRSAKQVSSRTTTISLPNSAAVRVSYRGDSRSEVRAYFEQLTAAVQSSTPPTQNIRPGTLRLLRVDSDIPQSGGGSPVATIAGGIAGLLLGAGAASFLGRAAPRVASARELRQASGPTALDVDVSDRASVAALTIRLLDGLPEGAWLAVVSRSGEPAAKGEFLARLCAQATNDLHVEGAVGMEATSTQWLCAPLGGGGERLAQDADRVLLAVAAQDRLSDVQNGLSDLHDLGVRDVVIAVVSGKADLGAVSETPTPQPRELVGHGQIDDDLSR